MKLIKKASKSFVKISWEEWIGIGRIAGFISDVIYVDENEDGTWQVMAYSAGQELYLGVYPKDQIQDVIRRYQRRGYDVKVNVDKQRKPEKEKVPVSPEISVSPPTVPAASYAP